MGIREANNTLLTTVVPFGSWLYFLLLLVTVVLGFLLHFFLKNKTKKFQFSFLLMLCFIGFSLHFVKQFFPYYRNEWPYSLRTSSFENICAVLTILQPFLFLFGKKYAKDALFYVGLIAGGFALLLPTVTISSSLSTADIVVETIRYYVCHNILFLVGLLMVTTGNHKLNFHRIWAMPLFFLGILAIIFVNEAFLCWSGLVTSNMDEFLSPNFRNAAFVFGIPSSYMKGLGFVNYLVPWFFRIHPYDPSQTFYLPVVWAIIPVFIAGIIMCFLLSLPFESRHVIQDIRLVNAKLHMLRDNNQKENL